MSETSGNASAEIVLAKETLALVARTGGFIYFLKTIEDEMIRKAVAQFELILLILKAITKCRTKVSQIKEVTEKLKNLTKIFYFKKCALSKDIEDFRAQIKMKIELVRRSKNLAKEVGKSVKKATMEKALSSSWVVPRRVKEDGQDDRDFEHYSLTRAEGWWNLLEKCVDLAEARISSVEKSLKIMANKEQLEKMMKKFFLQAAIAAQLGKIFQKRHIVVKNMEIGKMMKIHQRRQKENIYPKILIECRFMMFLANELNRISEVFLSEISPNSEMEK
ncbi:uncharacterized protein LOC103097848 [Monodelphis domestica]|uniref:uncharacterized protein LOC103097848 n=1 Tax=Monodelphis domestica TaxID=13616 RepID=UPI0024E245DD|nr:uncharacterized protein LOC103097848 [Monodelphis domestica]